MSAPARDGRWRIWIDRGGTFTDCVACSPDGELRVMKLLSLANAPIEGIRRVLGLDATAPIPPCDVRIGTTLATNALLERKGAPTALVTARGFGDVLAIGDQTRPDLFALCIEKPALLHREVLEVSARVAPDGTVLERPAPEETRRALAALHGRGHRALAVVLLHATRAPALEREIGAWAHHAGFAQVSLSHEVANEVGFLARGDTTVVDAYLTPVIAEHVRMLRAQLGPESTLRVMQSNGGLASAERFRGRDAILSGPAGGVIAVARVARALGLPEVIGLDVGGTSTDVSRWGGEFERVYETEISGVRLRAPMLDIRTIAAGGGSICRDAGDRFTVGPDSAGAEPGPLCYGRPEASALTLTDVNLALGRVVSERFPFVLDRTRVDTALTAIADRLRERGDLRGALGVAEGFFEVAVAHTAEAMARVSIARGHDPRSHALVVFGGAGGQIAGAVARRLGIRTVVFPPLAGVLSAWGLGVADVIWHGERDAGGFALGAVLPPEALEAFAELEDAGRSALTSDGYPRASLQCERRVDLRYRGTEVALTVRVAQGTPLADAFETLHRREFGYARPGHAIEVAVLRVDVIAPAPIPPPHTGFLPRDAGRVDSTESRRDPDSGGGSFLASRFREGGSFSSPSAPTAPANPGAPAPAGRAGSLVVAGQARPATLYTREELAPGTRIVGPAVVLDATTTVIVDPGFALETRVDGTMLLRDETGARPPAAESTAVDPVRLEVFHHLFMSLAEQMGVVLRRTALSTNIRDRLDFSCAVFDPEGNLVANAPHIPVHLGAMGESVRAVLALHPRMEPGDVFATNDPALGGSHVPDVTVITPIFDAGGTLRCFTASRGHHADIGGATPGSMPPFSRSADEEGVVLRGLRIVRGGVLEEAMLRDVLTSGPYPARDPAQNLADLVAQAAANRAGEHRFAALVERHGLDVVRAYMCHVQDDGERRVRAAIAALPDGRYRFADAMDDGTRIAVEITVRGDAMEVDFAGTAPQVASNLNAPRAVTVAAVLYVLRALVNAPIPLNAGCLRPLVLRIPPGSVLDPAPGAAVAAGNVETSQRVVDVLLGALGKLAACQGTMNNLTFGDAHFGYYETIAGGAGAGPTHAGASGVHTHMTNTRITDVEVLEARYPLRVIRFALRPGSGGRGLHAGGDGLVREFEALAPLDVSILSERRTTQPFGLAGGESGAAGHNFHGERELPGRAMFRVEPGERFRVETPGGGGWGTAEAAPADGKAHGGERMPPERHPTSYAQGPGPPQVHTSLRPAEQREGAQVLAHPVGSMHITCSPAPPWYT